MDIPDKDLRVEFYDCDVFDTFKNDMASMEHPIYSLSKLAEHRILKYERNDYKIEIKTGPDGLPTVLDKDIMVYLTSSLMASKNKGEKLSKTIRFIVRDYLTATGKSIGGSQFKQVEQGLDRLKGTTIKTNIKTNGVEITKSFGIIDSWTSIKQDHKKKSIAVEVKLSDWCYNSILGSEVLTIDPDYFKLGKPTERRLYELARKHCGNQMVWKIKLETLKEKLGTTSPIRTLRFNVRKIAETNHLPEYNISMEDDVVMFTRKSPPKEHKAPIRSPKYITKKEIEKVARPGETYAQVAERIKKLRENL
jgi:plasmid replication initiation protein